MAFFVAGFHLRWPRAQRIVRHIKPITNLLKIDYIFNAANLCSQEICMSSDGHGAAHAVVGARALSQKATVLNE